MSQKLGIWRIIWLVGKVPSCPKLHWFCAVKQPTATTLSTRRNTTFPAKSTVYLVQPLNLNCLFQVDAASSDSAASVWDQLKVPEEMFGFLLDRDQLAEARVNHGVDASEPVGFYGEEEVSFVQLNAVVAAGLVH